MERKYLQQNLSKLFFECDPCSVFFLFWYYTSYSNSLIASLDGYHIDSLINTAPWLCCFLDFIQIVIIPVDWIEFPLKKYWKYQSQYEYYRVRNANAKSGSYRLMQFQKWISNQEKKRQHKHFKSSFVSV